MPILKFKTAIVKQLAEHALKAPEHSSLYDQASTAAPGLWLVGDRGIYLMSNGKPALGHPDGVRPHLVAFAEGTDPDKDKDWYDNKRAWFGGDDGVNFIGIDEPFLHVLALCADEVKIAISPTDLRFIA